VSAGAWADVSPGVRYAGQSPEVKRQIVDVTLNTSGICDTARVLHVSPITIQVNQMVLTHLHPEQEKVELCRADEWALPLT
jgi:transposase-like protein